MHAFKSSASKHTDAMGRVMKKAFDTFTEFLRSSKRTVVLILIVVAITIVISAAVSIMLQRITNLSLPSLGTIKTIGVEAYWDRNCENETKEVKWDTAWPGSSQNVTFYLRSISNIETTLNLAAMNWSFFDKDKIVVQPPTNISEYMNLSWNYNGTTVHPNEITQVTLTLSASSSKSFITYLISNEVREFSLDIIITTSKSGS